MTGPQGATGAQGPQGMQGPAGPTGAIGPQGATGNGIASTTNNGDGTFTFTYDDGSTFTTSDLTGPQGATGAQGPQGIQGVQGPAGTYTAGTGIIINNNQISVDSNALPNNSQGVRIGFSSTTTWTCPTGVTQITVELWGGGGGGGGAWANCVCPCSQMCSGTNHAGGSGGKGGYNKGILSVVPGTIYSITVGNGGASGSLGQTNCGSGCWVPNGGGAGSNGQASSFNGILSAPGGTGATPGSSAGPGSNGINGSITNYSYPSYNYGTRSYIPSNYLTPFPINSANGGSGGIYNVVMPSQWTGTNGENGYCVISY